MDYQKEHPAKILRHLLSKESLSDEEVQLKRVLLISKAGFDEIDKKQTEMREHLISQYPNSSFPRKKGTYFDYKGNPISFWEWGELRHDHCRIAVDTIGEFRISTVYIGMDLALFSSEFPVIFETMIFTDNDDEEFEFYRELYSFEEQAKEGHKKAVRKVKNYLKKKKV